MTGLRPGSLAVAAREARWILRDPVARFLIFAVPVIAFTLLGLTFSSAVVRGLDVVVVDRDDSTTSRLFVETLAAAPGIAIADRANDLGAAASAIRAGRAIAAASRAVAPAQQAVGDRADPGPGLVPEEYVLANPALNYAQFLLRAVLPTVLHVVIAISTG